MYKVKSKATGAETLVTPAAYNLAKKRFQFISQVHTDKDGHEIQPNSTPVQSEQIPNNSPQEKKDAKAAAPVVNEQPKKKPGPKPKTQISSQPTTVEV